MAKTAKEMSKNADEVLVELDKALADEWLAYMQYKIAASLVNAPNVASELESVAKEELEHIEELNERIIQLGGKPIADPRQFHEKTNCGYEVPVENGKKVLADAIEAEGCAIKVYQKVAEMTKDTDYVTHQLMVHIMEEEIDHEQKFSDLKEWMEKISS
jgi:bacterioferritin